MIKMLSIRIMEPLGHEKQDLLGGWNFETAPSISVSKWRTLSARDGDSWTKDLPE